MKRPRFGWRVVAGTAVMAVATAALAASPALAAGPGFQTITAGSSIAGWTVTSGSVDWISTYWQEPAGVTNSFDLNGTPSAAQPNPAGTISQTLGGLEASEFYAVTFEMAGNPMCGPSTKGLTVDGGDPGTMLVTGITSTHLTFSTSSTTTSNMGWTKVGPLDFLPRSGAPDLPAQYTLTFTADPGNTSNCGPAIANVVVTPTNTFLAQWG